MTFKRGRDPKEAMDIGLLIDKRELLKKIIINNIRFLRMDILLRPGDVDLIEQVNIHLDQEKDDYKGISRIKFSEPEMEQILNEYDELMEPVYKVLKIQMKKARKESDVAIKQMKEL